MAATAADSTRVSEQMYNFDDLLQKNMGSIYFFQKAKSLAYPQKIIKNSGFL